MRRTVFETPCEVTLDREVRWTVAANGYLATKK
jgi:hypothetical protein